MWTLKGDKLPVLNSHRMLEMSKKHYTAKTFETVFNFSNLSSSVNKFENNNLLSLGSYTNIIVTVCTMSYAILMLLTYLHMKVLNCNIDFIDLLQMIV